MGRGISFNYDWALDRATQQFWRTGYTGTSLRDLLKAIGIGEGSFYNTLGSKKQLYLACLQHYGTVEARRRVEAFRSASSVGAGLRAMFGVILDSMGDPQSPSRLCMMAAMLSPDVLADDELRAVTSGTLTAFHAELTAALAKDDGNTPRAGRDTDAIASVLMTYAQGLWRMALVEFDRPRFERQVELFLCGLGL